MGVVPQYPRMANDRICPNCRGLVTRGEEFCSTCGEWLGIEGSEAPEQFTLTSDGPLPSPGTTGVSSPAHPAPPGEDLRCPLCGAVNPPSNRHCEQCGARLNSGQLPVAPQPAIQTTAAMRTALIAGAVVIAVVAIAFIFNALRGDDEADPVDSTSTTSTTVAEVGARELVITRATCSGQWDARPCSDLIDGTSADWNAPIPADGSPMKITLEFEEASAIRFIVFENLPEGDDRFILNHRPKGVRITASDVASPISQTLPDGPGTVDQVLFATRNSIQVEIEIVSTHPSESLGEGESIRPGFNDLSIAEIKVFGVPAS